MPASFRKTLGALDHERRRLRRSLLVLLGVVAVCAAWVAWLALARVPVHAVSASARVQASDEIHPVDVPVSGRVTAVSLPVGARVEAGDVLLELDAAETRLQLDEAAAVSRGLADQIASLERELTVRGRALADIQSAGRARMSEADALKLESEAAAGLAASENSRVEKLHERGVVADAERVRARASLEQSQAEATARARRVSVLHAESRRDLADRSAEVAALERGLAELRTRRASAEAGEAKLRIALEHHTVRAPISGRIGQVRAPRLGSVVEVGQTIAVIAPDGPLAIAADFAPSEAVGRIRVGQAARMRADGFAWTQYGTVPAEVTAVSAEATDGLVRITLAIRDGARVPLRHGLTGTVEIELERVSPATLIMRAAGGLVTGQGSD